MKVKYKRKEVRQMHDEMNEILKYINEHLSEKITLLEMAKHFGYSRTYFCKKFKKITDTSFRSFVRGYKLSLAADAISKGEKVIDVAFRHGYDTVGGFDKAFYREFGCYPKNYKENLDK